MRIPRALALPFLLLAAPALPLSAGSPDELVGAAREAMSRGDLLTAVSDLEQAQKDGTNLDALLFETEVSTQEGYVELASHDLDAARELSPSDPRIVELLVKVNDARGISVDPGAPVEQFLAPTLQALAAGDKARADTELARMLLAIRGSTPSTKLSDVYVWRAQALASAGNVAGAVADYASAHMGADRYKDQIDYAKLLLSLHPAPGSPEAADGVAALSGDYFFPTREYPEVLWLRGQFRILDFGATHSPAELGLARVDLSMASRLHEKPVPSETWVALAHAAATLDATGLQQFFDTWRDELKRQTIELAHRHKFDAKMTGPLDLLLREILLREPMCVDAWKARAEICEDSEENSAIRFIVEGFTDKSRDKTYNTTHSVDEMRAWTFIERTPYIPERYLELMKARIQEFTDKERHWTGTDSSDVRLIKDCAGAIALLAPRSILVQEAAATRDAWLAEHGG